ncbi:MAG: DNA topoisomerase IB [Alphaproteobacteria bacterium]|nr:DNA topoisomerase IB [Alphaproteobacteria bacterium]MBU1514770.1 DNA topoisomerase IB [Alphaproteobacteria bacterium]MBU2093901.1 DNA topoisomerase IB [Alphaproteobacteria bacterium]MBU2153328.1 DNA topoisomerase IB [Alphaproteobacteria bacterium]MBU2309756.1 DNA topoisomerase IB [Alphaproteobacteria bacterium]
MPKDMNDTPVPQGLSYVSDQDPGIRRKAARGPGFNYEDAAGRPLTDETTLDRIRVLAIPPAWTDVWISPKANGHIQATGRDARGRKQYRYHARWQTERGAGKFDRVLAFGRALPRLRKRVDEDLARRGLPRDKVLAAVIRVMEMTLIRVGNEEYAKQNKSFGLTTLRDRHAKISRERAVFEFKGKSGKLHSTGFNDRRLARVVKACQDIPGQRLFQYLDDDGHRHAIESADVNAYIRETLGDDFSAKDFRTWAGTVAAARALTSPECADLNASKRNVNTCVKAVAGVLGNTAAVARSAYIHPAILDAYAAGKLDLKPGKENRAFELAVLRFLENAR